MGRHSALVAGVAGLLALASCGDGGTSVRSGDNAGVRPVPTTAAGEATTAGVPSTTAGVAGTDAGATTVAEASVPSTTTAVVVTTVADVYPLTEGSTGPEVERLQAALEWAGYDVGSSRVDGGFGPDTAAGVRMFQRFNGLPITGQADRALVGAIEAAPSAPMFVLDGGGFGDARIGDDPETVVDYFVARLGPPASDTGWEAAVMPCNLTEMRTIGWPGLRLNFGDFSVATSGPGPRQLIEVGLGYEPDVVPEVHFRTVEGLHAGDTVTRLVRLYPTVQVFPADDVFPASYQVDGDISGWLTDSTPPRVEAVLAGTVPCGE